MMGAREAIAEIYRNFEQDFHRGTRTVFRSCIRRMRSGLFPKLRL
jgi:hypothetical protein